jgi:hypothetical protein
MKKSIGCIIGVLLGLAGIAQATVVFKFDGANASAATANQTIVGGPGSIAGNSSVTLTLAYNTSTPLLSSGGTYTGQSVYGGFSGTYSNTSGTAFNPNFVVLQYNNAASPSTLEDLRSADTFTGGQISRAVNLAFLFGTTTNTGTYKFDANSVLTAKHGSTLTGTANARWVVVANGTTYLSESSFNPGGSSTTTLNDPDAINWAAWSPGADMTFGSLSYTTLGSSLNNITLAGVAVNYTAAASAGSGRYILQQFTADVIPEPATVGMLGLGALITLVLRRRMTR